jgi:hypothetical protein
VVKVVVATVAEMGAVGMVVVTAAEAMVAGATAAEATEAAVVATAGRHTLRTLSQGRRRRRCTNFRRC